MFCAKCGAPLNGAAFCSACGNSANGAPVGGPSGAPAGGPVSGQYFPPPPKTNGLAVASLVLSLLCLSPLALILGIVSLNQITKSNNTEGGKGLAIAGVVIGGLGSLGWLSWFVALVQLASYSQY